MRILLLLLAISCVLVVSAEPSETSEAAFQKLLDEAGLTLTNPEGYVVLPPRQNALLDYEHAVRSTDNKLEIRFAVRPLQQVQIDYDDPHGSVPDPNHIFPLIFESLAISLAGGGHTPIREYPQQMAQEVFNADWAAAAVFDVSKEFETGYSQGLLLAIHKSQISDAYSVFLFNDYAAVKPFIDSNLAALRFKNNN